MGQGYEVRGLLAMGTNGYKAIWLLAMSIGYSQLVMGFDIDNWLWVLVIGYWLYGYHDDY